MDGLMRISLLGGQARAFLVESTHMVEKARQIHHLSRTATAALGRTLTAASVLGCMLKGADESVTCRIDGGGPLGLLLAVAKNDGSVKGFAAHPEVDPPRRGEKLDVGAAVGRNGLLTVIKDMHMRDPYVGQVELMSGEIGEDFAMYFTSSEQTPSLVSLGVLVGDTVEAAGGLVIQMMPGASDVAIKSIELSAGMFMDISKTIQTDHLDGALFQLLSHLEPEVLSRQTIQYKCDCSRERVERALISLGEKELREMIDEQHGAEVDCHFCNTRRRFTEAELEALLRQAKGGV
ncbi:MAG: Hsp33 family molecular chaperone HslO [Clostridia bacterium]|nr:Hsp33 family molecular chaperone HslO [Clostridia bacterium]